MSKLWSDPVFPAASEHQKNCQPSCPQTVPHHPAAADEVVDIENSGQAVHGWIAGSQAVEKRRLDAGIRLFRDAKAQTGVLADLDQVGAQVDAANVQNNRLSWCPPLNP